MKEYDFELSGNSNGSGNGTSKAPSLESRVDPFLQGFTPYYYTRDGEVHYGRKLWELREELWYFPFRKKPREAFKYIFALERQLRRRESLILKFVDRREIPGKVPEAVNHFYAVFAKLQMAEQQRRQASGAEKLDYLEKEIKLLQELHLNPELLYQQINAFLQGDYSEKFKSGLRQLQSRYHYQKEEFLRLNMRLVKTHARRLLSSCQHHTLLDLVEEGAIGLMKAIDNYDYRRGTRFSTYASYWIRQSLTRSFQLREKTIYLPAQRHDEQRKIQRFKREYWTKHGKNPESDIIQRELKKSERSVSRIEKVPEEPISLFLQVGEDGMSSLGDFIADPHSKDFIQDLDRQELKKCLEEQLRGLRPQEEDILRRRFGLMGNGTEMTLQEVGDEYKLSRERIRQIEAEALRKLRHPSRCEKLEPFR